MLKFHVFSNIGVNKKTEENVLAGAHKTFERRQHTEMYFLALKAQDESKIELPPDRVISYFPPICLTIC